MVCADHQHVRIWNHQETSEGTPVRDSLCWLGELPGMPGRGYVSEAHSLGRPTPEVPTVPWPWDVVEGSSHHPLLPDCAFKWRLLHAPTTVMALLWWTGTSNPSLGSVCQLLSQPWNMELMEDSWEEGYRTAVGWSGLYMFCKAISSGKTELWSFLVDVLVWIIYPLIKIGQ